MMPFGGGTGRVGRSRMRLDEMDCADIMMKAVQRKRSRSIARRESFSGTEDDLRKFRDAVEANDKESKVLAADLQKDIDEYAVKVRQIRGDDDSRKKSGKEENAGVMRTDNEDTNLDKLPVTEDKCAIKINSNNLGENQSDCVSTAVKNTNEGVKNSEHSYGDTKDLNGDKKNDSEDLEQVTEANELQSYDEPKEVSNHQQNGASENHIQDEGIPKVVESSSNAALDLDSNAKDPDVLFTQKEITSDLNAKEPEGGNQTDEHCKDKAGEEDITSAANEDFKVQENEADLTEAPNEDCKDQIEEDLTATSNEDCNVQVKDLPAAPQEIYDQNDGGELMVDANNIEIEKKSSNEDEISGEATKENIKDQYLSEEENYKVPVNSDEKEESEVQTQDSADDINNDGENKDHELRTDDNSTAIELDIKIEETIESECDETASIEIETGPSPTNIPEAKANAVQISKVVSDQPQEANFLSIVDRIKTDITTLKTLSKSGTNASLNVNNEVIELTQGVEKALTENDPIASSQSIHPEPETSSNSENQVKISKELSSHLINLSSANISEQLRKSCSNIVAMNQDFSKEFLLKKLEELLKQESKQVSEDLERRREQLRETQSSNSEVLRQMTERHKNELRTLNKQQTIKLAKIENLYLDEIEDTRKEIELLENEEQNVKPQNQIINDCIRSLQPC